MTFAVIPPPHTHRAAYIMLFTWKQDEHVHHSSADDDSLAYHNIPRHHLQPHCPKALVSRHRFPILTRVLWPFILHVFTKALIALDAWWASPLLPHPQEPRKQPLSHC